MARDVMWRVSRQVAMHVCAAGLAACAGTGGDTRAVDGVDRDVAQALAAQWTGLPALSVQARPHCDSVVVGTALPSCAQRAPPPSDGGARLAEAAAAAGARLRTARTAGALHVLALLDASGGAGDLRALDRAVATIDDAVTLAGADASADLLTDQSALHLQRHAQRTDVADLLAGLEAAELAVARDSTHAGACWNVALGMTWIGLRFTAPAAWARCAGLSRAVPTPRVVDAGTAIPQDSARVALSGRFLEASQEYAIRQTLPRWAGATVAGNTDAARSALQELDSLVRLVQTRSTDATLVRLRREIQAPASSMRLARAVTWFTRARDSASVNLAAATGPMLDSAFHHTRPDEELHRWLRLLRVNLLFQAGQSRAVYDSTIVLERAAPDRQSLFLSRVRWMSAQALQLSGEQARAHTLFRAVEARCDSLKHEGCRSVAAALFTAMASNIGDDADALLGAGLIVRGTAASPLSVNQWSGMFALREQAVSRGLARAASALADESMAMAAALRTPWIAMESIYQRLTEEADRGDVAMLARELRAARTTWQPQLSPYDKAWYEPELLRFESDVIRLTDPARSAQLADSATRLLGAEVNEVRVSAIALARARSALATGDTTRALREYDALLARMERRGGPGMSVFDRVRLGRTLRDVAHESGRVLRARGRDGEALSVMSGHAVGARRGGARVAPVAGVLWRAVRQVGDSVWIWAPNGDTLSLRVAALPAQVTAAAVALDSVALTRVYEAILGRDLTAAGARVRQLHLDVQGPMAAVPWGALHDRVQRRYLAELVAIVLSDGGAADGARTTPTRTTVARVTLVDAAPRTTARALPGAQREVDSIAAVWQGRVSVVDARQGATATLGGLRGADVIHFAGHAMLDRSRPERSALLLPSTRDSAIVAAAIAKTPLGRPSLVVLAGCETRGFVSSPMAGFDSLAGAFLAAGAATVIGASWPVADEPTAMMMQWVHEALRDGASPALALQQAQVAAIRSATPAMRSPRTWAAFQVMGR